MEALGNFIQAYCTPYPIDVVRALGATEPGSNVRVPEPIEGDFAVITSTSQDRLEYNETSFYDAVLVGSIAADVLAVTDVSRGAVPVGMLLTDRGYPDGRIAQGTAIAAQLTGQPGGVGTYRVTVAQTLPSGTLYAGYRSDVVSQEWKVQVDLHGPNSPNNSNVLDALFRSEVGVDFFASQYDGIAPLNIVSRGLQPFENAEQEVEWRWVLEADLNVVIEVRTPQMFFDEARVALQQVGVIYAPPPSSS